MGEEIGDDDPARFDELPARVEREFGALPTRTDRADAADR
jgi:hypothetical protein